MINNKNNLLTVPAIQCNNCKNVKKFLLSGTYSTSHCPLMSNEKTCNISSKLINTIKNYDDNF